MINFCTLFDTNYLSRGVALYSSLKENCTEFHLYIFAFNDKALRVLKELNLEHATLISLKEFEDAELLKVKPTRSVAEYCWTSTSSTILYVLENYNVESCTYLDADLFFYSSPESLLVEMGDKSILITEHRYSPQYNKELKSGKYCVQFVTFKNDVNGLTALRWWRERCLEWCYAYYEDGKFGDQLYLDDWTERFDGVHVLEHPGGGLAPWNVQQYDFFHRKNRLWGREKKTGNEFPAVFYHFHYLRFQKNGSVELGRRTLSQM
jgi:lipopolysaccharide biosynthesis glycosyltransferase